MLVTLGNRYSRGQYQTYAGTALLIINPQMEQSKVYEKEVKKKFFLPSFLPFFLNFYFKFPLINLCIFFNIISTTSAICLRLAQTRNPTFSRWSTVHGRTCFITKNIKILFYPEIAIRENRSILRKSFAICALWQRYEFK